MVQSPCFTPEAAHFLVYGTTLKRRETKMFVAIPDADIQGKLQVSGYLHVSAVSATRMQANTR